MRYGDWIVMTIVKRRSNIHASLFAVDVVSHLRKGRPDICYLTDSTVHAL